MKSTLRSKLAAAVVLLVPMGAMLAAQPAAAQHSDGYSDRGYERHNRDFRRDHRAPRITDVTPDHGERVGERGWTRISARFHDRGTGVASVRLRVDGRDVTGQARVHDDGIRYAENLQPGRHFAELVVRDRAGNATRQSWSFDVVQEDRGYDRGQRYGYYGQPQRW